VVSHKTERGKKKLTMERGEKKLTMVLSVHYNDQTIQYHEDDCFSCNTGVTTVKMSNVSEERRQEVSTCTVQIKRGRRECSGDW
jgi:hypothetical protein